MTIFFNFNIEGKLRPLYQRFFDQFFFIFTDSENSTEKQKIVTTPLPFYYKIL